MAVNVSLDELVERGAHFGHQSKRWNPKMSEYIYGEQDGVHIFDLVKTKAKLEEALEYLKECKENGKVVLFVGTKKQAKEKVAEISKELGVPYITERWLGGLITNFGQIKKSITKLQKMREEREKGEHAKFTKKERLLLDREIDRLERFFGGLENLNGLPDALFVIDSKKEFTAIREASAKGVKIVALVDTNSDPSLVDFPIPMNDDASKALDYVLDIVKETMASVKTKVAKDTKQK